MVISDDGTTSNLYPCFTPAVIETVILSLKMLVTDDGTNLYACLG
jgi:hypothetical protein